MTDLNTAHVRDGIFVPRGLVSKHDVVYDSEGRLVDVSGLYSIRGNGATAHLHFSNAPSVLPKNYMRKASKYDESVVFLGIFDELHYGHWLTEGLSRFWYFLDHQSSRRIVMSWNIRRRVKHFRNQRLSLGYQHWSLGLSAFNISQSQFIKVNKPTRFQQIDIPYPSLALGLSVSPRYFQVTRKIADSIAPSLTAGNGARMIYLSRSRWRTGNLQSEMPIEDFCRSRGIEIIHPQLLSLAEQINVISEADTVIGRPGSSFHTLMFRRNPVPARCIYLWTEHTSGGRNCKVIDSAMGNESFFVHCFKQSDDGSLEFDCDMAIDGLKQVIG